MIFKIFSILNLQLLKHLKMDYKGESREMVYKHQNKLNDIVEL